MDRYVRKSDIIRLKEEAINRRINAAVPPYFIRVLGVCANHPCERDRSDNARRTYRLYPRNYRHFDGMDTRKCGTAPVSQFNTGVYVVLFPQKK